LVGAVAPVVPSAVVKPDDSEYLIRFQSAKPVQTAVQQLLAIGEKWSAYGAKQYHVSQTDGPTDVANSCSWLAKNELSIR
jgi:hypothetical protein